jgi:hypothetical protein
MELPHLRTFCLEWPDRYSHSLFLFLETHSSLTELYIGGDAKAFGYFMAQFEKILNKLRCLKVLSLRTSSTMVQSIDRSEATRTHDSLETIIIKNILWSNRGSLSGIWPIFQKLNLGELPACKVIKLGGYFDGCIDANIFSNRVSTSSWGTQIRICKERGVAVVDETGQELFVWADRHRIRYTR